MGNDIEGIIGTILGFFVLIIVLGAMIPVFNSLTGSDNKQREVDSLNQKIAQLNAELEIKNSEIAGLKSIILATNKTLTEKDNLISNLTITIQEKDLIIENLKNELEYFEEKGYIQDIHNNYYNISNYFEKIEKQFFPIHLSISLISITLFAIILKEFAVISFLKRVRKRLSSRKEEKKLPPLN